MADPEWTEPGRWVSEAGAVEYAWPPEGRFADIWRRCAENFTDEEKYDLGALLRCWETENSHLVAFTDEDGEWVDVRPQWDEVEKWLAQPDGDGGDDQ